MRQLAPDRLDFAPLPGELPRGRLTIGDHQAELPGARIEAAYALEQGDPVTGYLFFTSDDIAYEEVLSITLTDQALQVLDRAWIGAPYQTALLSGTQITGPGRVEFRLEQAGLWRLTVLARPRWRLPGRDGAGWQGLKLRRHFRLERLGTAA